MATLGDRIPSGVLGGGAWMLVSLTKMVAGTSTPEFTVDLSIASELTYDEDYHVNPAEVIGFLGPIAYDSQGYTCQLSMTLYVKRPSSADTTLPWDDIEKIFPLREQIIQDGALAENELRIYDIATFDILNAFEGCVLSTNGVQLRPNSYITRNARYYAVQRYI